MDGLKEFVDRHSHNTGNEANQTVGGRKIRQILNT